MTQDQLTRRKTKAQADTLVITEIEDGFRVYAPASPGTQYLVAGTPEAPTCTCPDYRFHARNGDWKCRHILAVLKETGGDPPPATDPVSIEERRAIEEEGRTRTLPDPPVPVNGIAEMHLKRSVSPDGRIDALSVEFTCAVDHAPMEDIRARALHALKLQGEIVQTFLGANGKEKVSVDPALAIPAGAVSADLLDVAGMNTRWGRRLFINVKVNGDTLKLFGTKNQLEQALAAAGFPELRDRIAEGATLAVPCRVTTKPSENGKYRNVDRLFPAETTASARSAR